MAPHSSTLAWKIPWMEEPGRLQSMGSLRVRHDWATSLSFFTFMHWRRKWQPTPVLLPGESQGQGSLVGCQTSMGSHRVGHDWSDLAAVAAAALHLFTLIIKYQKETITEYLVQALGKEQSRTVPALAPFLPTFWNPGLYFCDFTLLSFIWVLCIVIPTSGNFFLFT